MNWIVLAYASLFSFGMADNLRGPLFPEILSRFHLSHTMGSIFFLVVSAVSIPGARSASYFVNRWGYVHSLRFFLALQGLSQVVYALAPSFGLMLVGSLLFGWAAGGIGVVQNVMVMKSSRPDNLSRLQGGLHACYGASSLMSPLVVIILHRMSVDWQLSFLAPALISFVVLFATYVVAADKAEVTVAKQEVKSQDYSKVEVTYFGFILAIYVAVEILIASRLPIFLREVSQFSLEDSSLFSTYLFVGLLAGRLLTAIWPIPLKISIQLRASLGICVVLMFLSLSVWPPALAAAGFFLAPFYPLMMTSLSRLYKDKISETAALAISFTGYTVVGMHFAGGFIADAFGIRMVIWLGVFLTFVTFLMIQFYPRFFGRQMN